MTTPPKDPIALEERHSEASRLHSPSTARNRHAIASTLAPHLPTSAAVLEIGSGTGEHAVTVCQARPDISWQPSDPDPRSRESQAAWAELAGGQIRPPLDLNLMSDDWAAELGKHDALVCMNVIHISPWRVTENLARHAASCLSPDGLLYLYGPYQEGGETAPSNLDFDTSLRSRNPEWGVRNLDTVVAEFEAAGFEFQERIVMPANNLSLMFKVRSE
jgi:SAM-dependent methyltransferase